MHTPSQTARLRRPCDRDRAEPNTAWSRPATPLPRPSRSSGSPWHPGPVRAPATDTRVGN